MASAQDFLNELKGANTRIDGTNNRIDGVNVRLDDVKVKLDALKAATDAVRVAVEHVDKTLTFGFTQLINLGVYTNQALAHNNKQNDTIICILEHISKNTCELLNQSELQTALQAVIKANTTVVADLYASVHADEALERERHEALRLQIEKCCPPPAPVPPCGYEPCRMPRPIGEPPRVEQMPPSRPPNG